MFKKTITYEDYNGETVTEDLYFHLSKADILKLQMKSNGGITDELKKIVDSNDGEAITNKFEEYVLMSYGVRDSDGRRFNRSKQISDDFSQTEAYSEFFTQLVTDAAFSAEFVNGLFPAKLIDSLTKDIEKVNEAPREIVAELPEETPKQPQEMSREELLEAFKKRSAE